MRLHTVFITYNRLELTRRAIASYVDTVTEPFHYTVVDNGSTDGTEEWLKENVWGDGAYVLLGQNLYPGKACNTGWSMSHDDDVFLHRADNDFVFKSGWCTEVARIFQDENIGQVGLRTDEEEDFNTINVGGNCVIRRELWDEGLRFDERPWPRHMVGWTEDAYLSIAVENMGYLWKRVEKSCIDPLPTGNLDDDYYKKSLGDRGIYPPPCT